MGGGEYPQDQRDPLDSECVAQNSTRNQACAHASRLLRCGQQQPGHLPCPRVALTPGPTHILAHTPALPPLHQIEKVDLRDEGIYTCAATNLAGESRRDVALKVLGEDVGGGGARAWGGG